VRLDRPLRKAVVRLWLVERGFRPPDARHLDRLLDELPAARADANPCVAWSGCEVRRYRGEILALHPLPPPPSPETRLRWRVGRTASICPLPAGLGHLEWHPLAVADGSPLHRAPGVDQTPSPDAGRELVIRFGPVGATCRPAANGPSRTLKKLFQEAGVPVWLRPYLPQVFDGERRLAIAGVTACHGRSERIGLSCGLSWSGCPWARDWPQLTRLLEIRVADDIIDVGDA
jgi:tRNA(Ile)-lysidine synthase